MPAENMPAGIQLATSTPRRKLRPAQKERANPLQRLLDEYGGTKTCPERGIHHVTNIYHVAP